MEGSLVEEESQTWKVIIEGDKFVICKSSERILNFKKIG